MTRTALTTAPDIPQQGLPVTIITGFLGSGKTTLLNHVLQNNQGLKVAVLVNEFGDIDIDTQLLVSIDEDMVQLSNGCICCTINDGLIEAVFKVLERDKPVDYLVVETTGVADPLPVALSFLATELKELTRLDSVVTLIDAATFDVTHYQSDAALNQVVYGDVILLNKVDLISPEKLAEVENTIRLLRERPYIIPCQYGQVPLDAIIDIQIQDAITKQHQDQRHHHQDHHEHHHHESGHLSNDGFVSISFQSEQPFALDLFQAFLDQLPDGIFRAKGLLWFDAYEEQYIFQMSGQRYSLDIDLRPGRTKRNQLVLIGRNLNTEQIQVQLNSCLCSS